MEDVLYDKAEIPVPDVAEMIEVEFQSEIRENGEIPLPDAEILSDSSDDESNHENDSEAQGERVINHCNEFIAGGDMDLEIIYQVNVARSPNSQEEETSDSAAKLIETCSEKDSESEMERNSFVNNATENLHATIETEDMDDSSCEIIAEYPPRGDSPLSDSPSQSEASIRSSSVIQWAGSTQASKEEDRFESIPVINIEEDEVAEVTVHVKHLYPSMYHVYRCICCDGLIGHRKIRRLQSRLSPHDLAKYRYRCSSCGNGYLTEGQLKRHLIRHGEKRFGCWKCTKKFCTLRELQSHAVVHTADRPFPCPHCAQSFRQSSSYYSHLKSHIVCEICSSEGLRG